MSSSLPPSPGPRPASWRAAVDDVADRLGASPSAVVGGLVVLLLGVVVGALLWTREEPPAPELSIPYAAPDEHPADTPSTTAAGASEVTVHVAGAVAAPGVYVLPSGSRVGDAVSTAGGPLAGADLERLNLAAPVADGSRVYVPRVDQPEVPGVLGADVAGPGGSSDPASTGPIDLNTADAAALEDLPGVGPATAAAIVAHREEHGPFSSVEELLEVRGIGEAKLAAIRDLVAV